MQLLLPRDEALMLVAQHSRNEVALVDVMLTLWDANRRSVLTALLHHVNARVLRQYACALAYRQEADAQAALHWLRAHGSSAWAEPFADVQARPQNFFTLLIRMAVQLFPPLRPGAFSSIGSSRHEMGAMSNSCSDDDDDNDAAANYEEASKYPTVLHMINDDDEASTCPTKSAHSQSDNTAAAMTTSAPATASSTAANATNDGASVPPPASSGHTRPTTLDNLDSHSVHALHFRVHDLENAMADLQSRYNKLEEETRRRQLIFEEQLARFERLLEPRLRVDNGHYSPSSPERRRSPPGTNTLAPAMSSLYERERDRDRAPLFPPHQQQQQQSPLSRGGARMRPAGNSRMPRR